MFMKTLKKGKSSIKCRQETERYYLAYGSNLNENQMKERCPGAKRVGTAIIKNFRLSFRYNGNSCSPKKRLTIDKAEGYEVPVGVYIINQKEELELDRKEGLRMGCYVKQTFSVELQSASGVRPIVAYTYVMPDGRPFIESEDEFNNYVEKIRNGYEAFGFDSALIDEAIKYSE